MDLVKIEDEFEVLALDETEVKDSSNDNSNSEEPAKLSNE